jgi:hypothetical protein
MTTQRERDQFRRDIQRFHGRRDDLLERDRLSLEPKLGTLAIHVSRATFNGGDLAPEEQIEAFEEEGELIRDTEKILGNYKSVELYPMTDKANLRASFRNPNIASIVVIGQGSLGAVRLPQGNGFTWWDVATASKKHLKTGSITQRTCGHVLKNVLAVPFGTFAVSDQRNLFAPLGEGVADRYPDEGAFKPVYKEPHNSPADILERIEEIKNKRR